MGSLNYYPIYILLFISIFIIFMVVFNSRKRLENEKIEKIRAIDESSNLVYKIDDLLKNESFSSKTMLELKHFKAMITSQSLDLDQIQLIKKMIEETLEEDKSDSLKDEIQEK